MSAIPGARRPRELQAGVRPADRHAEAVEVTFDPARVSYEELLALFWSSHTLRPQPARPQCRHAVPVGDLHALAGASRRADDARAGDGAASLARKTIATEIETRGRSTKRRTTTSVLRNPPRELYGVAACRLEPSSTRRPPPAGPLLRHLADVHALAAAMYSEGALVPSRGTATSRRSTSRRVTLGGVAPGSAVCHLLRGWNRAGTRAGCSNPARVRINGNQA